MSTQNENGVILLPVKIRFMVFVAPRDYGGPSAAGDLNADLSKAHLTGLTPEAFISVLKPRPQGYTYEELAEQLSHGQKVLTGTPLLAWQVL